MMTFTEMQEIVGNIKYNENGWEIRLKLDENHPYLQVYCTEGVCNVTGKTLEWSARKWMLSPHMCRSEIVRTAYKAIEAAVLHEMNEKFTYKGECIFDPHFDVEELVDLRKNYALDTREHNIHEQEKLLRQIQKKRVGALTVLAES